MIRAKTEKKAKPKMSNKQFSNELQKLKIKATQKFHNTAKDRMYQLDVLDTDKLFLVILESENPAEISKKLKTDLAYIQRCLKVRGLIILP